MPKKSKSLKSKLDTLFREDPIVSELDAMVDAITDAGLRRFNNVRDFKRHLSEGALLNINQMGSRALSIPCGEYMVMTTDAGHTMLVPIGTTENYREVFEGKADEFEILTPKLMGNWHNVERVLAEYAETEKSYENPNFETMEPEKGGEEDDQKRHGEFKSKVDPADIDRSEMLRAMQQRGHTVTSLADATGVDVPAISRLLRTPKPRTGDPGGRNPSIGLASKIANTLRMDVEALFPDIFGVPKQPELGPRKTPGNRGSGMTGAAAGSARKGKATAKWTQGGGPPE
jgi:hypothetical protein